MKKQTYLHIAEPCHENWSKMSTAEQGRFCNSCCKTVTDFSMMSDKEILQVLSKAAGNSCGRFTNDQLERPLYEQAPTHSKPYKFFLSAIIPTFLLANLGMAQRNSSAGKTKQGVEKVITGKPARNTEGKTGEPTMGTPVLRQHALGEIVISDTSIKAIDTAKANLKKPVIDELPVDNIMMGGIQVYEKVTVVDTVKTYVRKALNQNSFRILGNPAAKGSLINFQFKKEGKYMMQFLDASGKLIYTTDVTSTGKNGMAQVTLPNNFIPGTYFVKVTDSEKKCFTDKVNIY